MAGLARVLVHVRCGGAGGPARFGQVPGGGGRGAGAKGAWSGRGEGGEQSAHRAGGVSVPGARTAGRGVRKGMGERERAGPCVGQRRGGGRGAVVVVVPQWWPSRRRGRRGGVVPWQWPRRHRAPAGAALAAPARRASPAPSARHTRTRPW